MTVDLRLPNRSELRNHVVESLGRYWQKNTNLLENFPISDVRAKEINGPLKLQSVELPEWAAQWAIEGVVLIPVEAFVVGHSGESVHWEKVDWWLALFLMLECWHERLWEKEIGKPIHSYSFRLKGWDTRIWDAAWVNRIALFLREWVARSSNRSANDCFGLIPKAEFEVTHDVDAISKTTPIRFKQGAFHLFNGVRFLLKGQLIKALNKIRAAFGFFFHSHDWWTFDQLLELERDAGIKACFNFYADRRSKSLKSWLFDPGYEIDQEKVKSLFQKIRENGGVIGLHPTFDAWEHSEVIEEQRKWLSQVTSSEIRSCRQHWLRFSWSKTWSSQAKAGIRQDSTLMFNDRSGFRSASAFQWQPWDAERSRAHELTAIPTMLMDSHSYDYQPAHENQREDSIVRWFDECRHVGGHVAVLWHHHTLSEDYGWLLGFHSLLRCLKGAR